MIMTIPKLRPDRVGGKRSEWRNPYIDMCSSEKVERDSLSNSMSHFPIESAKRHTSRKPDALEEASASLDSAH
jgi:hypothetical protein